jgi:hypothetical protein
MLKSILSKAAPRVRPKTKPVGTLSMILLACITASSAVASDTDKLTDCVATADVASTAAKSRDAGISAERTIVIIANQVLEGSMLQVNRTVNYVYSDQGLTPEEASTKVLQSSYEME